MKGPEVMSLLEETISTLARQRSELRALWRRFRELGEMDLARGLLAIPGAALGEELDLIRRTLQAEEDRRRAALLQEARR